MNEPNVAEEWRPVVGYARRARVLVKTRKCPYGYLYVERMFTKVHSLVASTFLGPRQPGMVVNHKDGDKLNNHVANLEYLTARENIQHYHRVIKPTRPEKLVKYAPQSPGLTSSTDGACAGAIQGEGPDSE